MRPPPLNMFDAIAAFRDAISAAGFQPPSVIELGKIHRFPTRERRGDTAGWCRLFPDLRAGVFGDWRTGVMEVWRAGGDRPMTRIERVALDIELIISREAARAEQRRVWSAQAVKLARMWDEAALVTPVDPVGLYLARRCLDVSSIGAALRLAPKMPYYNTDAMTGEIARIGEHSVMLAQVVGVQGQVVALHRTYLSADGWKAAVPAPKKLTRAAGRLMGGAIRLHRLGADGVLGVAEGIETAAAATLGSGVPTWAAVSANGMASFEWPPGVRRIVVFADNDASGAGQKAAEQLALRARTARLSVEVLLPTDVGTDWADVWAARGYAPSEVPA